MTPRVYLDTSVWLAPYDQPNARPNQRDVTKAIERIFEYHQQGKIRLLTSAKVKGELQNQLLDAEKCEKARQALGRISQLRPEELPRAPADYAKAIYGQARYNVAPKFMDIPEHEPDQDVTEFLTENYVSFFVTLDDAHILSEDSRREIELRLQNEGTAIATPLELLRRLRLKG